MAKKVSVKEKVEKAKQALITEATPEAAKNVTKQEVDMEFSVQQLKDKIKDARSMTDLESTQEYFESLYGVGAAIPYDIQALYDLKVESLRVDGELPIPQGWVRMTKQEATQFEKEGRLAGYDAERGCGLLSK